ncbi:hypothetical protein OIO90_002212 [Microbotryomycetes sp. JL221]|nr:hypothetical protein OIO90_002212 [Microbotryomycetes sp. JL221]
MSTPQASQGSQSQSKKPRLQFKPHQKARTLRQRADDDEDGRAAETSHQQAGAVNTSSSADYGQLTQDHVATQNYPSGTFDHAEQTATAGSSRDLSGDAHHTRQVRILTDNIESPLEPQSTMAAPHAQSFQRTYISDNGTDVQTRINTLHDVTRRSDVVLQTNEAYQRELLHLMKRLAAAHERLQELEELLGEVEEEYNIGVETKIVTDDMYTVTIPWFRYYYGQDLPPNLDGAIRELYNDMTRVSPMGVTEKSLLRQQVIESNKRALAEQAQQTGDSITRTINKADKAALLNDTTHLDWDRIASFVKTRSVAECRIQWLQNDHPLINKKRKWPKSELDKLFQIAKEHNERDWQKIADELGTRRTAIDCLRQYRKRDIGKQDWTREQDERLIQAINIYGENWRQVALYTGRKLGHCINRWTKTLRPHRKGKWMPEEDQALRNAVEQFGTKWQHVHQMVPGRTDAQCRERWCNHLDPNVKKSNDKWSAEEDAIVLRMRDEENKTWSEISAALEGTRTDSKVRLRYGSLTRKLLKQPRAKSKAGKSRAETSATASITKSNDVMKLPESISGSQIAALAQEEEDEEESNDSEEDPSEAERVERTQNKRRKSNQDVGRQDGSSTADRDEGKGKGKGRADISPADESSAALAVGSSKHQGNTGTTVLSESDVDVHPSNATVMMSPRSIESRAPLKVASSSLPSNEPEVQPSQQSIAQAVAGPGRQHDDLESLMNGERPLSKRRRIGSGDRADVRQVSNETAASPRQARDRSTKSVADTDHSQEDETSPATGQTSDFIGTSTPSLSSIVAQTRTSGPPVAKRPRGRPRTAEPDAPGTRYSEQLRVLRRTSPEVVRNTRPVASAPTATSATNSGSGQNSKAAPDLFQSSTTDAGPAEMTLASTQLPTSFELSASHAAPAAAQVPSMAPVATEVLPVNPLPGIDSPNAAVPSGRTDNRQRGRKIVEQATAGAASAASAELAQPASLSDENTSVDDGTRKNDGAQPDEVMAFVNDGREFQAPTSPKSKTKRSVGRPRKETRLNHTKTLTNRTTATESIAQASPVSDSVRPRRSTSLSKRSNIVSGASPVSQGGPSRNDRSVTPSRGGRQPRRSVGRPRKHTGQKDEPKVKRPVGRPRKQALPVDVDPDGDVVMDEAEQGER